MKNSITTEFREKITKRTVKASKGSKKVLMKFLT